MHAVGMLHLFYQQSGPDTRPFVSVFEPWSIDDVADAPAGRRSFTFASEVTKFSGAVTNQSLVAASRSCEDRLHAVRREWLACCDALIETGLVAAGIDRESVLSGAVTGVGIVQPDGSRVVVVGGVEVALLPPDPLAKWRSEVDKRLGLMSRGSFQA